MFQEQQAQDGSQTALQQDQDRSYQRLSLMIKAVFAVKGEKFIGFTVKGHSGYAESGNDIICAGVSSALMLTVNTITDFFSVAADMDIRPDNEGYAKFRLKAPYVDDACTMIKSFYTHLTILEEEYGHIDVRTEQC